MKKIGLYIDACGDIPYIELFGQDSEFIASAFLRSARVLSESLLQEIDRLLARNKFSLGDISMVAVNPGPGSYTSMRISLTTANFLAYSLNIPISVEKKIKAGKFSNPVLPIYYSSPVITRKKSRL